MNIRTEVSSDIEKITEVTKEAFENMPISRQTEHYIINALRKEGALSLSLVAEIDNKIIGHVAFSPIKISDGSQNWYGLGPVSVKPELQKKGVGKELINKGIQILKERGGRGCALVGDPNYYKRFGFKNYPQLMLNGVPQEFFLALPFYPDDIPQGFVTFHEAFMAEK